MAIKKKALAQRVIGVSTNATTLETAQRHGAIDEGTHDIKKAVQGVDLVILATPVNTILELIPVIGPHLRHGCIVTDVGSSKAAIVEAAHRHFPSSVLFVGSHPLAGSEKRGPQNAREDIFENSTCIMTPVEQTNRLAKEKVKHLWTKLGASVKTIAPAEHDQILAYISHLPHLLAYGLMKTVPEEYLDYATSGLKDTTRIAGSDPRMWKDICFSNSKNILKSIDDFVKHIGNFRRSILERDENSLMESFKQAKTKRDGLEKLSS